MGSEDLEQPMKSPKGILKHSSNLMSNTAADGQRKSAKFDELNVLATLTDAGRHSLWRSAERRNQENKTQEEADNNLNINELTDKLRQAANTQTPSFGDEEQSDDEFPETPEEKVRRLEFERRRKGLSHREFDAVRIARRLIEDEFFGMEDDDDDFNISIEISNVEDSESAVLMEEGKKLSKAEVESEEREIESSRESFQSFISDESQHETIEDVVQPSHPCYGKINLERKQ